MIIGKKELFLLWKQLDLALNPSARNNILFCLNQNSVDINYNVKTFTYSMPTVIPKYGLCHYLRSNL